MTRFAILSIALVGLGVAGCNDDSRYVCVSDGPVSDRGCFICEGDECTPQPAPTRALCATQTDCAVGETCTSIGCVSMCASPEECPIGTTCADGGMCLNPLEPDPVVTEPDPELPRCQFNFECGDSEICIDGECLATCLDAPCPDAQQCVAGACRPCTDESCLVNCTEDAECADNELCSEFQCVPDTRPEAFCPENACQPGRICVRGQCRTPCDTDDQCARIDATIRFCAPVEGTNLCVRSIEVLSDCQLNIDCGLGEECVDGACASKPESP